MMGIRIDAGSPEAARLMREKPGVPQIASGIRPDGYVDIGELLDGEFTPLVTLSYEQAKMMAINILEQFAKMGLPND